MAEFKNNPGCDCCGGVLFWDMGVRKTNLFFTSSSTIFTDWSTTALWLQGDPQAEEEADKVGAGAASVDFALGAAKPDPLFWGEADSDDNFCMILPDPSTQFDPNTDAVDLGYWSGNLHDYSLVFWHCPFSAETLWEDYINLKGGDCQDDILGCQSLRHYRDAAYVWGGVPDWWEDVATGTWEGRVVILLGGTPTASGAFFPSPTNGIDFFSGTSTMTSLFVNTLSDVHGMELDVSERRTTGRLEDCESVFEDIGSGGVDGPSNFISTTCVHAPSDPFAVPAEPDPPEEEPEEEEDPSDVMDGVERLFGDGYLHRITGGTRLAVQTSSFRDFCIEDTVVEDDPGIEPTTYTYTVPPVTTKEQVSVARHVLVKEVDGKEYKVEFVICDARHARPVSSDPGFDVWHKRFVRNLFTKPLAEPEEEGGGEIDV